MITWVVAHQHRIDLLAAKITVNSSLRFERLAWESRDSFWLDPSIFPKTESMLSFALFACRRLWVMWVRNEGKLWVTCLQPNVQAGVVLIKFGSTAYAAIEVTVVLTWVIARVFWLDVFLAEGALDHSDLCTVAHLAWEKRFPFLLVLAFSV